MRLLPSFIFFSFLLRFSHKHTHLDFEGTVFSLPSTTSFLGTSAVEGAASLLFLMKISSSSSSFSSSSLTLTPTGATISPDSLGKVGCGIWRNYKFGKHSKARQMTTRLTLIRMTKTNNKTTATTIKTEQIVSQQLQAKSRGQLKLFSNKTTSAKNLLETCA